MSIREIIRLFLPPIYYMTKNIIKRKKIVEKKSIKSTQDLFYEYIEEINCRASLPFSKIRELSKDISFQMFFDSGIGGNEANFYGDFYVIQKYMGVNICNIPPKNINIQHGMMHDVNQEERLRITPYHLTWSHYMQHKYDQENPKVKRYSIGAPFFYADSLLSEYEILQEKKRLGKNLLAFPMHSTHFVISEYSPTVFLNKLVELKSHFDTIRVCLYWKDILLGRDKIYHRAGFECVCCGHMFDINFLRRQKSLFEIADVTISNSIGSHIGYSIYMNKPTWLVQDDIKFVDTILKQGEEANRIVKSSIERKRIISAFNNKYSFTITDEQRSIVDEFWGISDIKTPVELTKILNSCR